MVTTFHRPITLLVGLLLAFMGGWSDGECADDSETAIAGRVRVVAGGTIPAHPNSRFTVMAIDEAGRIVARQSTDDAFRLTVPSDHDYVLIMSQGGSVFARLIWGEHERPEFAAHGPSLDLGYVGLNPDTHRAVALRELDLRPPRATENGAGEQFLITEE